jgi:hypothetical protein
MSVSTEGASTICQKVRTLPKGPLRAMLGVERVRLGLRIRLFDVIGCEPVQPPKSSTTSRPANLHDQRYLLPAKQHQAWSSFCAGSS